MTSNRTPRPEPLTGRPAYLIDGKKYPMVAIDTADLWAILDIQEQTGLTMSRLEVVLREISEVGNPGAKFETETDVFGSREHLLALAVQMWLARRAAGETGLTIREASSVPVGEWVIVNDAPEEVTAQEPDPTESAADSAPAETPA